MNSKKATIIGICKQRPKTGFTRREIEEKSGFTQCTVAGRVNELVSSKALEPNGTRYCTRAGHAVGVVRVAT